MEAKRHNHPLLQNLQLLATAATCAARHKRGKGSSFGQKTREENRLRQRLRRLALWHRTHGMTSQDRAHQVAVASNQSASLNEAISAAKTLQLLDAQEHRKRQEAHHDKLSRFRLGEGLHNAQWLKEALPGLPVPASALVPLPCANGMAFALPPTADFNVTTAAAYASHHKDTNLAMSLENEWLQLHEPLPPEQCPALPSTRSSASRCRESGMCVCKGHGKETWVLKNRFLQGMKLVFSTTKHKHQLCQGLIIVRISNKHACSLHEAEDQEDVWLHIGSMSFSPYRPTFHELKAFHDAILVGDRPGRVALQARHPTPPQKMEGLSLSLCSSSSVLC